MAAPAYVGAGTYGTQASKDTNLTLAWPGGSATAGHLAICQVAISDQGSSHTPPSFVESNLQGFRRLGPQLQAIGFTNTRSSTMRLYYKVLAGSDTLPTFQMTGGNGAGPLIGGVISTYSGDVGAIRLAPGNVGDTDPITGTGITTKAAGGLVAAYTAASDDAALSSQAFTDPASPTERYDHETGARMGLHLATGIRTAAGATGNFTATPDELDTWCVMVLALEETEAFPSESVIEPFTYSDGELDTVSGGDWADDTFAFSNDGLTVSSNQANNSSANDERSYYAAAQAEGDGEVAATVATLPATSERVMLGYRIQDPDTAGVDGYEFTYERRAAADGWILSRIDNGSYTTILDVACDIVAGDVIGVAYAGSIHDVFIKPSSGPRIQVGSVSEGTYTAAGYVALGIKGSTARVDDFIAGPLDADETAPSPVTSLTLSEPVSGTIRVGFTMPADADAEQYRIRYKAGTGQSFSSPTDGTQFVADAAATPSQAVSNVDATGFTPGSAYTIGVWAGDEVPNWSTVVTDDLTLDDVLGFAPTTTAVQEGPVVVGIPLAGAATGAMAVAFVVEEGDPIDYPDIEFTPTMSAVAAGTINLVELGEIAFTPTVTAVMAGKVRVQEPFDRPRPGGLVGGPLTGGVVGTLPPRAGGPPTANILSRIGRRRR